MRHRLAFRSEQRWISYIFGDLKIDESEYGYFFESQITLNVITDSVSGFPLYITTTEGFKFRSVLFEPESTHHQRIFTDTDLQEKLPKLDAEKSDAFFSYMGGMLFWHEDRNDKDGCMAFYLCEKTKDVQIQTEIKDMQNVLAEMSKAIESMKSQVEHNKQILSDIELAMFVDNARPMPTIYPVAVYYTLFRSQEDYISHRKELRQYYDQITKSIEEQTRLIQQYSDELEVQILQMTAEKGMGDYSQSKFQASLVFFLARLDGF